MSAFFLSSKSNSGTKIDGMIIVILQDASMEIKKQEAFARPIARSRTAQAGIEFMALVGIALFVVLVFTLMAAQEVKEYSIKREYALISDVGMMIQKEMILAGSVEDGYARSFYIPEKLKATTPFSVIVSNSTITLNTSKSVFSARIPSIKGNFTSGTNRVYKQEGVIYVNS